MSKKVPVALVAAELQALTPPGDGGSRSINALRVTQASCHYLGKDASGAIVALFQTQGRFGGPSDAKLEHIEIIANQTWRALEDGSERSLQGIVAVRCRSAEPRLVEMFVQILSPLAAQDSPMSGATIGKFINTLVDLFAAVHLPARREAVGVWGEVLVLVDSTDPIHALGCWRRDPTEVFDFSWQGGFAEVKTTTADVRRHHFRLSQVSEPAGRHGGVVSIRTRDLTGGRSISRLLEEWAHRADVTPEMLLEANRQVAVTLGETWLASAALTFDDGLARQSMIMLPAKAIPRPMQVPAEVSEISFVANLSQTAPLTSPDGQPTSLTWLPSALWRNGSGWRPA